MQGQGGRVGVRMKKIAPISWPLRKTRDIRNKADAHINVVRDGEGLDWSADFNEFFHKILKKDTYFIVLLCTLDSVNLKIYSYKT